MKVQELIDQLGELNPAAEVRLAYQPNYPLWEAASALVAGNDDGAPVNDAECHVCGGMNGHEHGCTERIDPSPRVDEAEAEYVYVTSGGTSGYASKALWDGGAW